MQGGEIAAIVISSVIFVVIVAIGIMCWKFRSNKSAVPNYSKSAGARMQMAGIKGGGGGGFDLFAAPDLGEGGFAMKADAEAAQRSLAQPNRTGDQQRFQENINPRPGINNSQNGTAGPKNPPPPRLPVSFTKGGTFNPDLGVFGSQTDWGMRNLEFPDRDVVTPDDLALGASSQSRQRQSPNRSNASPVPNGNSMMNGGHTPLLNPTRTPQPNGQIFPTGGIMANSPGPQSGGYY